MDDNSFNFELVSPEKVLVSEPAWQVTIPGEEGYFGVRKGHMSLIAAIRPGVVEVLIREGDAPQKIFIAGGFADVTPQSCTILAEQAISVSDLNAQALEAELATLKATLANTSDLAEQSILNRKIMIASLKLQAAGVSAQAA